MDVLIVESNPDLGGLWQRHLQRQGAQVVVSGDQTTAIQSLQSMDFDVIVLDLVLENGSPLAIADYASYRRPDSKIVFVTNDSFFSDGSIFQHCSNACAFVPTATQPEDLAAIVDYHGRTS